MQPGLLRICGAALFVVFRFSRCVFGLLNYTPTTIVISVSIKDRIDPKLDQPPPALVPARDLSIKIEAKTPAIAVINASIFTSVSKTRVKTTAIASIFPAIF